MLFLPFFPFAAPQLACLPRLMLALTFVHKVLAGSRPVCYGN